MQPFIKFLSRACLALAVPALATAAFDGSKPILCAIHNVDDCGADYDCVQVTPESVALPDFFTIDLASKQITSAGTADVAASPIGRIERLNGKLILQGGDASGDNARGSVGWTMTINEDDGRMVIAGVGEGFALVVFGSCLQQ